MANVRWQRQTGDGVRRNSKAASVPTTHVILKRIWLCPKRLRDHALGSKCSGVVGTRERSALSAQRVHTTPAFDPRATETILCHPVLVPRAWRVSWVAGLRRGRG